MLSFAISRLLGNGSTAMAAASLRLGESARATVLEIEAAWEAAAAAGSACALVMPNRPTKQVARSDAVAIRAHAAHV